MYIYIYIYIGLLKSCHRVCIELQPTLFLSASQTLLGNAEPVSDVIIVFYRRLALEIWETKPLPHVTVGCCVLPQEHNGCLKFLNLRSLV